MHLYEIKNEILSVIENCDQETWEIDTSKFDTLELSLKEKAENIAMVIRKFEWYEDTIATEIKRLQAMKKHYESQENNLKEYLKMNLEKLSMTELETPLFKVSLRKSEETIIEDIEKIPSQFKTIEVKVNKTDIKKAIKLWEIIEGARIQEKLSLNIK